MARHILPLIPEHKVYVEPFFGSGALYWRKAQSEVEIINDTDREVINFYDVIQVDFEALRARILSSLHSRSRHEDAKVIYFNPHLFSKVERAWAVWAMACQGFAGKLGESWGYSRDDAATKSLNNRIRKFTSEISERISRTQIECNDALQVIHSRDTENTLFYVDPPYFNSNCGHYGGYTEKSFRQLLELLSEIKGKFILSSYPSELLDNFITSQGWKQHRIEKAVSVTHRTKKRKVECLTMNF